MNNPNQRDVDDPFAFAQGRAGGFGELIEGGLNSEGQFVPDYDWETYPGGSEDNPSSGPTWWQMLIGGGTRIAHDALTPVPVGVAQARASQPQVSYQPIGYPRGTPNPNPSGIGIGLDGNGIRLSDGSHIGWFPIIGLIGMFFLLQSPGFQRKSR